MPISSRTQFKRSFYPLPLGTVRPRGWLEKQLRIQAEGLSGNLEEVWPRIGPDSAWLGGNGESWELGPYYLDGLVPLAYLLNDSKLKAKAAKSCHFIKPCRKGGTYSLRISEIENY